MRTIVVLVVVVVACGGDDGHSSKDAGADAIVDAAPDAALCAPLAPPTCSSTSAPTSPAPNASATCNPLTQSGCAAGEKCTWIVDQMSPVVGHVGCAPTGTVPDGCACTYGAPGATGYDDCETGTVCNGGTCKQICDQLGGSPKCTGQRACVVHATLFSTGDTTPPAAGVCDKQCDPLTENNFLTGAGANCACGSNQGCYGYPSYGTAPATSFTCANAGDDSLVHRSEVLAGGTAINTCARGYLPLLRESATVSTTICVAICKPVNCYAGHCGTNDDNRLGVAPHRCTSTDRRGTFDNGRNGEQCEFWWRREMDPQTRAYLPSIWGDTIGICFDHSKYQYDSDGDNVADTPLPACQDLQDGFGAGTDPANPLTYFGAADLGCVDSTRIMMAGSKRRVREHDDLRPLYTRTAR